MATDYGQLVADTPDAELCALWGASPASVRAKKKGERPVMYTEMLALLDSAGLLPSVPHTCHCSRVESVEV